MILESAVYLVGGFVALAGVIVGSFLNALVWRIHKEMKIGGKARSQCPVCDHKLAWYDLIPVVSWIILRARCRHCKDPISVQYPVIEVLNGLLWLVSLIVLSPTSLLEYALMALWLIAVSTLVALAVYDIRWMLLPDRLVIFFTGCAALYALIGSVFLATGVYDRFDPLLGVAAIAGLFYILYQISDGKWIGGGDVKLAVGMGLFLGLQGSLLALFLASFIGSIVGVFGILVLRKSRKAIIPFGPFLITGTVVTFLFGDALIGWYMNQLI